MLVSYKRDITIESTGHNRVKPDDLGFVALESKRGSYTDASKFNIIVNCLDIDFPLLKVWRYDLSIARLETVHGTQEMPNEIKCIVSMRCVATRGPTRCVYAKDV